MRYQEFKLFPTTVLKFDCSDVFTPQENAELIEDVNKICTLEHCMQFDELTPKYQSRPILFQEHTPPHWQKLKQSFMECCEKYVKQVDSFTKNPDSIRFTHARAWFYKGWKSLNQVETNPWHQHNPAFLSGVYYLKLPVEDINSGTEFSDPRVPEALLAYNQAVGGTEHTWVIFPGWLSHKSGKCDTEDPRITIAADIYAMVL